MSITRISTHRQPQQALRLVVNGTAGVGTSSSNGSASPKVTFPTAMQTVGMATSTQIVQSPMSPGHNTSACTGVSAIFSPTNSLLRCPPATPTSSTAQHLAKFHHFSRPPAMTSNQRISPGANLSNTNSNSTPVPSASSSLVSILSPSHQPTTRLPTASDGTLIPSHSHSTSTRVGRCHSRSSSDSSSILHNLAPSTSVHSASAAASVPIANSSPSGVILRAKPPRRRSSYHSSAFQHPSMMLYTEMMDDPLYSFRVNPHWKSSFLDAELPPEQQQRLSSIQASPTVEDGTISFTQQDQRDDVTSNRTIFAIEYRDGEDLSNTAPNSAPISSQYTSSALSSSSPSSYSHSSLSSSSSPPPSVRSFVEDFDVASFRLSIACARVWDEPKQNGEAEEGPCALEGY